ncbi:MAG: MoxR family ATPase [Nanoarchaeota archaeon]|nr:MoxR family ATPase [Nanoarchaeota archaeon]
MVSTEQFRKTFEALFKEIGKVVIGQREVMEQMLIAMLCDGNALLEGYPGLAKTLLVKTMAQLMDFDFSRIQFTPDLMPSDITGTYVLQETGGRRVFKFEQGPIFANIILADEINRATPKTQSALLEAMQEKQVTVGNETFKLDLPFFVLATQNPIEQEGTYPLPEAQTDRFLLKITTEYPSMEEEKAIVDRYAETLRSPHLRKVLNKSSMVALQQYTRQIPVSKDIKARAVKIVTATRKGKSLIEYGASPRASIGLVLAAKARALIHGRNHVTNEDLNSVALPVLRHRIILNFEAERKGISADEAVLEILKQVK